MKTPHSTNDVARPSAAVFLAPSISSTGKCSRQLRTARLLPSRRLRLIALAVAALPVCQATGCFPDWLGALNFQSQLLIDNVLITAVSTIVMNILHL